MVRGVASRAPARTSTGADFNAWESFWFIDILLFLVGTRDHWPGGGPRRGRRCPAGLPAPPGLIIAAAGALAVLLMLFRLIVTPGEDFPASAWRLDFGRKIGVFLGLIAAGGITFGGWTAMNERASGQAPPQ